MNLVGYIIYNLITSKYAPKLLNSITLRKRFEIVDMRWKNVYMLQLIIFISTFKLYTEILRYLSKMCNLCKQFHKFERKMYLIFIILIY